jgi:PAS domain S-box-containing protein
MDEEAVQYAKEKYKELDAVVNIFTMRIVWASERSASGLGYTASELIGKSAREVMRMDAASVAKMFFVELISKNGAEETRPFKHKDGTALTGTATVYNFKHDGEPYLAVESLVFTEE